MIDFAVSERVTMVLPIRVDRVDTSLIGCTLTLEVPGNTGTLGESIALTVETYRGVLAVAPGDFAVGEYLAHVIYQHGAVGPVNSRQFPIVVYAG